MKVAILQHVLSKYKDELPQCKNPVYNRERHEELQPVLPDRACPRRRGRAVVAPHRARAIEHDQLRYSDLHANLEGCGTEHPRRSSRGPRAPRCRCSRRLPPPAASTVYALPSTGRRPPVSTCWPTGARGRWGRQHGRGSRARLARRRDADGVPPHPTDARIEFRVGDEVASIADGEYARARSRARTQSSNVIRRGSSTSWSTATSTASRCTETRGWCTASSTGCRMRRRPRAPPPQ